MLLVQNVHDKLDVWNKVRRKVCYIRSREESWLSTSTRKEGTSILKKENYQKKTVVDEKLAGKST